MTLLPANPKIYHIVHVDKLPSIITDGRLLCDATMSIRTSAGTVIGMSTIKERRLHLPVKCHPGLNVGDCVPFYFCPRSVMLYLIYRANHPALTYRGGQGPIVHLEFDLRRVATWADAQGLRWAFTLSNAGSRYFEDRSDLANLGEIEWKAVNARNWGPEGREEGKQAEFLVEREVSWNLVEKIGVLSNGTAQLAGAAIAGASNHPIIQLQNDWYY